MNFQIMELIKLKIFLIIALGASMIFYFSFISNPVHFLSHNLSQNDMPKLNTSKFVSVCSATFDGRRTGNMLFVLAGLLYASKLTDRLPIMPESFPYTWINHIFLNDLPRFPNRFIYDPNNSIIIREHKGKPIVAFDEQFRNTLLNKSLERVTTILICGYFQNYKYVGEVEKELRKYLKFKNDTLRSVDEFMKKETVNITNISYIGVHIRRTDFTWTFNVNHGQTVVDENYINTSMNHVIESMGPHRSFVAFICSDDMDWVKKAIKNINITARYPNLKVVYSVGHDTAFDLCLLSKCNASIISTGTFSWWSGWLASPKIGVYYSLFPNRKTAYGSVFNPLDYYPTGWKGFPVLNS